MDIKEKQRQEYLSRLAKNEAQIKRARKRLEKLEEERGGIILKHHMSGETLDLLAVSQSIQQNAV